MAATIEQFRSVFKEFENPETYDDNIIQYFFDLAAKLLPANRWNDVLDDGIYLYTAHQLSLQAQAVLDSSDGNAPGSNSGVISSQSVDKVSMSMDTGSGMEKDGGHWNLTTYGTRFLRLSNIIGAGPIHVGAPTEEGVSVLNSAWPGPFVY